MNRNSQKYYLENLGSFIGLDDREYNDLRCYDLHLIQVPGILYLQPGFIYTGEEIILSARELRAILQTTLNNSIN